MNPGRLTDFLQAAAARSFEYGRFDCFLFTADWCQAARGVDPGASIRGRYDDLASGLALVGVKNLPAAFRLLLGRAGLRRTRAQLPGDIALIELSDRQPRGAIVVAKGYMLLGARGLSRACYARCIAGWSLDA